MLVVFQQLTRGGCRGLLIFYSILGALSRGVMDDGGEVEGVIEWMEGMMMDGEQTGGKAG